MVFYFGQMIRKLVHKGWQEHSLHSVSIFERHDCNSWATFSPSMKSWASRQMSRGALPSPTVWWNAGCANNTPRSFTKGWGLIVQATHDIHRKGKGGEKKKINNNYEKEMDGQQQPHGKWPDEGDSIFSFHFLCKDVGRNKKKRDETNPEKKKQVEYPWSPMAFATSRSCTSLEAT